jgi:hypothetical protein
MAIVGRVLLAAAGMAYLIRVVRRRHRSGELLPAPKNAPWAEGNPDMIRSQRWERVRSMAAVSGFVLLFPMAASTLLGGPLWVTTSLLIGVGLATVIYLVASALAGWFEGRSSRM